MVPAIKKRDIILQLQQEVLSLQGFTKAHVTEELYTGLGAIDAAFQGGVFPVGAVHEFSSAEPQAAAATHGFIAGLLGRLMHNNGSCIWISPERNIFPPALKLFGIEPERVIFIELADQKNILWAVEEALRCNALAAVVGELKELGFTESRRLQLAVEKSRVTGFIHRYQPRQQNPVACVARWKIKPLPGLATGDKKGVGFARWDVQLLKVRNGKPGAWQIEWNGGAFRHNTLQVIARPEIQSSRTA